MGTPCIVLNYGEFQNPGSDFFEEGKISLHMARTPCQTNWVQEDNEGRYLSTSTQTTQEASLHPFVCEADKKVTLVENLLPEWISLVEHKYTTPGKEGEIKRKLYDSGLTFTPQSNTGDVYPVLVNSLFKTGLLALFSFVEIVFGNEGPSLFTAEKIDNKHPFVLRRTPQIEEFQNFELCAVVHFGDGHFTTSIRTNENKWLYLDDAKEIRKGNTHEDNRNENMNSVLALYTSLEIENLPSEEPYKVMFNSTDTVANSCFVNAAAQLFRLVWNCLKNGELDKFDPKHAQIVPSTQLTEELNGLVAAVESASTTSLEDESTKLEIKNVIQEIGKAKEETNVGELKAELSEQGLIPVLSTLKRIHSTLSEKRLREIHVVLDDLSDKVNQQPPKLEVRIENEVNNIIAQIRRNLPTVKNPLNIDKESLNKIVKRIQTLKQSGLAKQLKKFLDKVRNLARKRGSQNSESEDGENESPLSNDSTGETKQIPEQNMHDKTIKKLTDIKNATLKRSSTALPSPAPLPSPALSSTALPSPASSSPALSSSSSNALWI